MEVRMTGFAFGLLLILAKLLVLRMLSRLPTHPEATTKAA
jgi:hypothetical protein